MEDLIYDQGAIPKDKLRYGLRASSKTGCGWVATHNALRLMGYRSEPGKLIHWYESSLPVINGNFGTFIFSVKAFFDAHGFKTKLTVKTSALDTEAKHCDVGILFYRWRKNLRLGAHYVAVQYKNERYMGLNALAGSKDMEDYGLSLEAFLKKRGYFGAMLVSIYDDKKREDRGKMK